MGKMLIFSFYTIFFYKICKERLPLLNLYKYVIIVFLGFCFFWYSSDLAPLKNKNKISIKQVKGLQKKVLAAFFFWGGGGGGGFLFVCFVIVWSDIEV